MEKLKVENAIGRTLCHDMTGIVGDKKGVVFARGHVIREDDVQRMLDIGKSHIFVWSPDADEVHEDDAALAVAGAACGDSIDFDKKPSEGKIVMYAKTRGLFRVNRAALRAINSVGDYTLACLPGNTDVCEGQKLGGIRIIPLVTKRETVDAAVMLAREGAPVFSVAPYKALRCGVIITGSEIYYGRIEDRFEPVMREKLGRYGGEPLGFVKCPDDLGAIGAAIDGFLSQGAELILLTGGMSVDPDDLTPSAIRACGAEVIAQGMPMQPGNMLMIAYKGSAALVGVPGASLHSPVTSLDVFLPRIFAGIPITREEIPGYGEGGFCMGCNECGYPQCYFGRGI